MRFKVERLGGTRMMAQHVSDSCAHCSTDIKSRRRDFSEQAWAALVAWAEIQTAVVDQPVCDDCYNELREVLIDRADEIEAAAQQPQKRTAKAPARAAAQPVRGKVRKAG